MLAAVSNDHNDWMTESRHLDWVVSKAVQATAETITPFGSDLRSPFREREMQCTLVGALQMTLAPSDLELTPRSSYGLRLETWPKVGPVDVALLREHEIRSAFLELKWGAGTLYNCVWDLAKMAVAVCDDRGSRVAYLVAGAPRDDWAGGDGADIFSSGTTTLVDLYERYPSHWRKWRTDVKTHPRLLPQLAARTHVCAVPVSVRDETWEIRAVRVSRPAGYQRWWLVAPVERATGVCDLSDLELATDSSLDSLDIVDSPYPEPSAVHSAEDHRRFDEGDVEALWRLVRDPPRWWRFVWFPGDVDFIDKTLDESWGTEQAELLRVARSIKTRTDLARARSAIEAFVAAHPGDPTAISAAQSYVLAERALASQPR